MRIFIAKLSSFGASFQNSFSFFPKKTKHKKKKEKKDKDKD